MTVTRANVEAITTNRIGPLMTLAGLDASIVDGTNGDLNDSIGFAIRTLGYTVTDITDVADADLTGIATTEIDDLLDLTEYRALETIIGNYDDVDLTVGPRSEKFSQTVAQVEKRLARLKDQLEDRGLLGIATIGTMVITHDFAEHDADS